jgi:hypothetical protein
MTIRVYVESAKTEEFSGTSTRTGKNFCFFKQAVHAFLPGSKFPKEIELAHDTADKALRPGEYSLDVEAALTVDRFGGLGIDSRKLQFVPAESKPAAVSQAK